MSYCGPPRRLLIQQQWRIWGEIGFLALGMWLYATVRTPFFSKEAEGDNGLLKQTGDHSHEELQDCECFYER